MIRISRAPRRDYFRSMTPGWIACAALFGAGLLSLYRIKQTHDLNFYLCLLRQSTGLKCPLCGGTTATIFLATGAIKEAFALNPLVSAGLPLFALWSLLWLAFGWRVRSTLHPKASLALGLVILGLNWIYVLANTPKGG